ncbi:MAG: hypothetical protein V5A88_05400 [Candidatus Thermoplasmatota archaeon]
MVEREKRIENQEKLKEINHLLKGEDVIKNKPQPRDLADDSYEITNETLCILSSEYNILIIHDGVAEMVNDLSPEEIVEKIKEYAHED